MTNNLLFSQHSFTLKLSKCSCIFCRLQQNGGQEVVKDAIRAPKLDSICQMKVNSSHVIKPDTINRSDSRSEQSTGINCVASENNKPLENPESQLSVENKNIHSDYVEINNKAVKNEESLNFVFATSLLSVQQNKMLGLLVRAFNIKYSKTVNEHVTHLIVSTSDGCTKNTYKVLYAMALHKPIIRFEWVEEVLTTATLLPMVSNRKLYSYKARVYYIPYVTNLGQSNTLMSNRLNICFYVI